MKSVLISIQPKWCELIASGKKTVEVRKTKPKLETPFRCYIYATKPKRYYKVGEHLAATDENLYLSGGKVKMSDGFEFWADGTRCEYLSGKVIGEFVCDDITKILNFITHFGVEGRSECELDTIARASCLDYMDMLGYLGTEKDGYAWHISDLVIYEKPRSLGEIRGLRKTKFGMEPVTLTRPPQSWCYVEGGE